MTLGILDLLGVHFLNEKSVRCQVVKYGSSHFCKLLEQALKFEEIIATIGVDRYFPRFPYGATFVAIGRKEAVFMVRDFASKVRSYYLADSLQATFICIA